MANIKFILQQPYREATDKDRGEHVINGENPAKGTKRGKGKKKPLNPKETRLYCYFIFDRNHIIKIKTEYKILPKEWDFDKQEKKGAGNIEFNNALGALKNDIHEKYKEIIKQFPDMPFFQISKALKEYGKGKEIPFLDNGKDFFQVLDDYIFFLNGEVATGTIKKYTTLKNSLKEFGKANERYKTLTFSMIDHNFFDAYRKYLRNQAPRGRQKTRPEEHQKGLLLHTQAKYIESLKGFCKWAEQRNFNMYSTYKDFSSFSDADKKKKKSDHEIVTLTQAELIQFYKYDFPKEQEHLERVRDVFCFACFTGQRWGDFSRFEKSQLDGDVWTFIAEKTLKETQIDLVGYAAPALDILKKYEYKLPLISSQKFNDYLKEAGRIAGIDKETKIIRYVGVSEISIIKPKYKFLSSHCARRTCVSILLNDHNLSVTHVMGITGHTDLKTLQKYIKKDRDARRKAVSKTKSVKEVLTVKKHVG